MQRPLRYLSSRKSPLCYITNRPAVGQWPTIVLSPLMKPGIYLWIYTWLSLAFSSGMQHRPLSKSLWTIYTCHAVCAGDAYALYAHKRQFNVVVPVSELYSHLRSEREMKNGQSLISIFGYFHRYCHWHTMLFFYYNHLFLCYTKYFLPLCSSSIYLFNAQHCISPRSPPPPPPGLSSFARSF